MEKSIAIVVLAAGKGTRLKSSLPKPLIDCQGRRLVDYPLMSLFSFIEDQKIENSDITLITGHQREKVEQYVGDSYPERNITYTVQEQQLGTGHAVQCYFDQAKNAKNSDYTLILCADTPLLESSIYGNLISLLEKDDFNAVIATMKVDDPTGYGRIIRSNRGFDIVEQKDTNSENAKINEVNSGVYLFKTSYILEHLYKLNSNNGAGEFYLTDLCTTGRNVGAYCFDNAELFLGVNDFSQLEQSEHVLNARKVAQLQKDGVRFKNSSSVSIEHDVEVAAGSIIEANVTLKGATKIGASSVIQTGSILQDTIIENDVIVKAYSYLESAIVRSRASVGPYAHLRPNADIGEEAKIGNFVEVKKSVLKSGVKVSHLSYVGDAEIGENTNIGCGFITCNYDGANKHKTVIGKNSFIGSDTQMIAPIEIGEGCYVGSGSTINQPMPAGSFAIARGRQVTKENLAKKFIKTKK